MYTQTNLMSIRNPFYSLEPPIRIIRRMELAERLKRAMMKRDNISQYALAKLSGVPQPTINRILKGLSKEPKRSTLDLLADKLGVSRDWLISEKGDPYSSKPPILDAEEWNSMSFSRRSIIEKIATGGLHDAVIDALHGVIEATTIKESPKAGAIKRPATAVMGGPPSAKRAPKTTLRRKTE